MTDRYTYCTVALRYGTSSGIAKIFWKNPYGPPRDTGGATGLPEEPDPTRTTCSEGYSLDKNPYG